MSSSLQQVVDHSQLIEADTASDASGSDLESLYDSEAGSITETLASYAKRYVTHNGHKYPVLGKNVVSVGTEQLDQLDLFHEIYYRAMGNKLVMAPIPEKLQKAIDLGTGSGIWAIDFADKHPSCAVIGTDVAPEQPSWVPPNVTFEVDDFNMPDWPRTKASFDYVHARAIHAVVTDWDRFLKNCFKLLKPGGWLEIVGEDIGLYCDDNTLPEGTPIAKWMERSIEGLQKLQQEPRPYTKLREWIPKAGFDASTMKSEIFSVPIGTWPKHAHQKALGGMMLVNMLQGIPAWSNWLYTHEMSPVRVDTLEEYEALLESWKKDLRNKKQHKYMKIHAIYAQKPQDAGPTSQHTVS